MTKAKTTKRALLLSVLSMMLCLSMLVGSTFAWFTDSVTSGVNKIVAGNLDVELEYAVLNEDGSIKEWKSVQDESLFDENALWEPGYTQVVYLKVRNAGTLALKYKLSVNVAGETAGTNVDGKTFNLSDYLVFGQVESDTLTTYATREDAWAAAGSETGLNNYIKNSKLAAGATEYVALVVYMPTTVGNEANYRGNVAPTIELGINLVATQDAVENDSFGSDYDEDSTVVTYKVTPDNISDYLSGEYGSLTNAKLVLAPGDYGQLVIGAPSKYAGGDTVYECKNGNGHSNTPVTFTDAEEFLAHYDGNWHGTPYYTRTIDNLTIVGQEGVTIAGVSISSGHVYGNANNTAYDPVRDIYRDQSTYYMIHKLSNIKFKGISFTDKVNVATSNADTVIDGVTFDGCSFTTNGTASTNGAGLRYYNESNNGNVKNLTVQGCTFQNCFQGIYTSNINGITVTGCTFDTTGHNAIAIQSGAHGAVNHKAVVIENNTFNNIGDRIIRFGDVNADTQITIKGNVATNSGDDNGQIIKAQSLAEGIAFIIYENNWGENTTVGNDEFVDIMIDEGDFNDEDIDWGE